jgi:hypothetical protein
MFPVVSPVRRIIESICVSFKLSVPFRLRLCHAVSGAAQLVRDSFSGEMLGWEVFMCDCMLNGRVVQSRILDERDKAERCSEYDARPSSKWQ